MPTTIINKKEAEKKLDRAISAGARINLFENITQEGLAALKEKAKTDLVSAVTVAYYYSKTAWALENGIYNPAESGKWALHALHLSGIKSDKDDKEYNEIYALYRLGHFGDLWMFRRGGMAFYTAGINLARIAAEKDAKELLKGLQKP